MPAELGRSTLDEEPAVRMTVKEILRRIARIRVDQYRSIRELHDGGDVSSLDQMREAEIAWLEAELEVVREENKPGSGGSS